MRVAVRSAFASRRPGFLAGFLPRATALAALLVATAAAPARADVKHVVARGHTLEAIARRYHVSQKAIIDANHLQDPKHLRVGETLIIPGVSAAPSHDAAAPGGKAKAGQKPQKPQTYAMAAKTPGVIHAIRLATTEDFTIRVADRRGRTPPTALKTFEHMLRSAGGQTHPIDPRLVALVGVVSNHFGSRKLEIISGFRPYSPTQHTPHSNHNQGKAMDFRVMGVPNEVLRDFCRTLKNVGCGYYPNSTFVHMDVRSSPAYWIDYSKPGEPPRYDSPSNDADEGTTDVSEEIHAAIGSDGPDPSPQQAPAPAPTPAPPANTATPPAVSK